MNYNKSDPDYIDNSKKEQIPADVILYSYYTKYDTLKELIMNSKVFREAKSNTLNVYIDFYNMVRSFYDKTSLGPESFFTSSVLNLAAHLKHFFMSRFGIAAKIYIISTTNTVDLSKTIISEWSNINKITMVNPQCNQIITKNIGYLNILCQYIPNVYFVQGTVEPSVMIYNLCMKRYYENDKSINLIVTKDLMSWQIPALMSNSVILRPRKKLNLDTSYLVESNNVLELWQHTVSKSKSIVEANFNPGILPLYIALSRFPDRNMESLYNTNNAIAILKDLIDKGMIVNGYNSPRLVLNVLNNISVNINPFGMLNKNPNARLSVIDVHHLYTIYTHMPESASRLYMVDKYDIESIKKINDKYFVNNPLNIIYLFR